MKSLKRTLSLVLVLVMVLGLVGISAGASFKDEAKINYKEAVGVMTGIGALVGYPDGTFNGTGTVTREEAVKTVVYAVLGADVAKTLAGTATGFADVDAGRWSSGVIAYAVSRGIINGRDSKTFDPTGNVTANEVGKMMLCAAGYGAKGEFIGSSWELNTAVLANKLGLFTSSKATNNSAPATREETALYTFNGLTRVDQVAYSKLLDSYGSNKGTAAATTIGTDVYALREETTELVNGISGKVWKAGTKKVSDFVVTDKIIGVSTSGASIKTLSAPKGTTDYNKAAFIAELDNKATETYTGVTYFLNGAPLAVKTSATDLTNGSYYIFDADRADSTAPTLMKASDSTTWAEVTALKGVEITFVNSDADAKAEKVLIDMPVFTQVTAIRNVAETKTVGAHTVYTIGGNDYKVYSTTVNDEVDEITLYAGIALKDFVMLLDLNQGAIVTKANTFTGKLTSMTVNATGNKYTIGGTVYQLSDLAGGDLTALSTPVYNTDMVYFTDDAGYIVNASAPATVTSNYAYVLDAKKVTNGASFNEAFQTKVQMLMPDGKVVEAVVSKFSVNGATMTPVAPTSDATTAAATALNKEFVAFGVNADGSYTLTTIEATSSGSTAPYVAAYTLEDKGSVATDWDFAGDIKYATVNNRALFLNKLTYATPPNHNVTSGPALANAATVFVVASVDASGKTIYTSYQGIANLPAMDDVTVNALFNKTGIANFVFISKGAPVVTTTANNVFFTSTAYTYHPETAAGKADAYREYPAIVAGKETTVKVYADATNSNVGVTSQAVGLFTVKYTKDVITEGTAVVSLGTTAKNVGGVIQVSATSYLTYAENAPVYVVSASTGAVKTITTADIGTTAYATVTAVHAVFTKLPTGADSTTNFAALYIVVA